MTWTENLILSVVEGLTEYLPVSSTGHLMIFQSLLKLSEKSTSVYLISIQFGAILAVLALYWKKFITPNWITFYSKLIVAFIPAAILGLLLDDFLESLLQTPMVVAVMLIIVGVFLIQMDKILPEGEKTIEDLTYKQAFFIGLIQTVAMIPGTSRSAASIAGGLGFKLTRKAATEFSFFLAVPTLSAAAGYSVLKNWAELSSSNLNDILIGNLLSFITALLAIKFFIAIIQKQGFKFFGYYRIIAGILFLIYLSI